MAMNTEDSLKEYLSLQLRLPLVARIGLLARTLDFVANAAPGVKEILTVGKLAYEVREHHYDLVVVDAAASGHVVGQLASPQAINDLVHVGVVADQTRWMIDILGDPARTGVVIVTTPEEMPVVETIELAGRLRDETNVDLAAVAVNRVLPELFGRGEEAVFERLRSPEASQALEAKVGPGAVDVLDAAELAVQLRRTRVEHLATLRTSLPPEVQMVYLPELFTRNLGMRLLARVSEALGRGAVLMSPRRSSAPVVGHLGVRAADGTDAGGRRHRRAVAGGQGDRGHDRFGWRREDDGGRRPRHDGRGAPRRQGARAHGGPGPPAGHRTRPGGVRQRREAGAARRVRRCRV